MGLNSVLTISTIFDFLTKAFHLGGDPEKHKERNYKMNLGRKIVNKTEFLNMLPLQITWAEAH